MCPRGLLCCFCGVLSHRAPVHRCARCVFCFACAVSWATWLLFTGVPVRGIVLCVRCPGPLGSCSPVCLPCWLLCLCSVLGHLTSVHRCPCSVCCVACAVSCATWLLFIVVRTPSFALLVRYPGPLGSCSPVFPPVCGVACAGRHCEAHTCPSRRRLLVAGRSWVPFERALLHSDSSWCCLAPVLVPWFLACCARSPALRHPAAVVAWHLSVCIGCGWRRAYLVCLVAPGGVPRLVRSSRSRCSGRLSRRRGAFAPPGGLAPPALLVGCAGHAEASREPGSLCLPLAPSKAGALARSASYPFRAPRWGCCWRVPPASVLGCVRCGGWRVWTRSLTRPVSRTIRRSTGDWAAAPGLFRVDADIFPCRSEDAMPGSRVCVHVLVLPGRVGRAGLPGAFWCASPFSSAALSFC